jgi:penicillin amidase
VTIGGKSVPIVIREEKVRIRKSGSPAGVGSDVEYEISDVPGFGVLLPNDIAPLTVAKSGSALLLRWTGFDITGPSRLTALNRSRTRDDFDSAVAVQTGLNFNMVAADAEGITYRVGVDVPVRDAAKHEPWHVMDGTDPSSLWTGELLSRDQLPHARAEERGWIATANNDPFGFTQDGRLDDDPWYYGAFFDPGWRAKRLHDELARLVSEGGVKLAELQALQLDVHDNLADDLLPLLDEAWANAGAEYHDDPRLVTLMEVLSIWDRRLTRDSAAALVFTAFAHFVAENTLADDLSLLYEPVLELEKIYAFKFALQALRGDFPAASEVTQGGRDAILLSALERTATEVLEPRFGGVDPELYGYGDLHVTSFADALGPGFDWGEVATDGGECTVNVSPHAWLDGAALAEKWSSGQGPILRLAVSFDADGRPRIEWNFPLGNVADPESVKTSGFTEDWTDGHYRTLYFSRDEVDAHLKERIELR